MDHLPATRGESPDKLLEPGDRFEITGPWPGDRLGLPGEFGPAGFRFERLEDPAGRSLEMTVVPGDHVIVVPGVGQALPGSFRALWLEYQSPGKFRLVA